MDINPAEFSERALGALLNGSVVPRPIAWVSTVDEAGRPNLAPFSYFNLVCANPPTLLFCPGIRRANLSGKDTYHNIRATGEFVVNFVTEELSVAMNETAADVPYGESEFEHAGLTALSGKVVRAPYVAESPIHFECRLNQIVTINEGVGGGYVVIGTVVHMHFDDSVVRADYTIDFDAYRPVARLSGAAYCRTSDRFELERPSAAIFRKN